MLFRYIFEADINNSLTGAFCPFCAYIRAKIASKKGFWKVTSKEVESSEERKDCSSPAIPDRIPMAKFCPFSVSSSSGLVYIICLARLKYGTIFGSRYSCF